MIDSIFIQFYLYKFQLLTEYFFYLLIHSFCITNCTLIYSYDSCFITLFFNYIKEISNIFINFIYIIFIGEDTKDNSSDQKVKSKNYTYICPNCKKTFNDDAVGKHLLTCLGIKTRTTSRPTSRKYVYTLLFLKKILLFCKIKIKLFINCVIQ